MSKTIFFILLSLATAASCNDGFTKRPVTCFNEVKNIPSKLGGSTVTMKFEECTKKQFGYLEKNKAAIKNQDMSKVNPKAYGTKTHAEIIDKMTINSCYISKSNSKSYRIVYDLTDETESFVPLIFRSIDDKSMSFDIASSVLATKDIFHVTHTKTGPIKTKAATGEVMEDDNCKQMPKNESEDLSTDISEETMNVEESAEESGSQIPEMQDPNIPAGTPVETATIPVDTPATESKTITEQNADLIAQTSADYKKKYAEQLEAERIAAEKKAQDELIAAEKKAQDDKDDDEIFMRAMAHLGDAVPHNNKLGRAEGKNIVDRISYEQKQRNASKRAAEEKENRAKMEEAHQKQLKIKAQEKAKLAAKKALEERENQLKMEQFHQDHLKRMEEQEARRTAIQAKADAIKNSKEQSQLKKATRLAAQEEKKNKIAEEKQTRRIQLKNMEIQQAQENVRAGSKSKKYISADDVARDTQRTMDKMQVILNRSESKGELEPYYRTFNDKGFSNPYSANIAAHKLLDFLRAHEANTRTTMAGKVSAEEQAAKLAYLNFYHDFGRAYAGAQMNERADMLRSEKQYEEIEKQRAEAHEAAIARLAARRQKREQDSANIKAMVDEGRKKARLNGKERNYEFTYPKYQPTVVPSAEPSSAAVPNAIAPIPSSVGAAYGEGHYEENDEYYAFTDPETPTVGGWGNWHACTQSEKDKTRNYFGMMFAHLKIHNIAIYSQNMIECKKQVVAGRNYEVKLGFNEKSCNVRFHYDLQGVLHDISEDVSKGYNSCAVMYAYPTNTEASA